MKILGLGRSPAARSASLAALEIAMEGAAEAGAEIELLSLRSAVHGICDYSEMGRSMPSSMVE